MNSVAGKNIEDAGRPVVLVVDDTPKVKKPK